MSAVRQKQIVGGYLLEKNRGSYHRAIWGGVTNRNDYEIPLYIKEDLVTTLSCLKHSIGLVIVCALERGATHSKPSIPTMTNIYLLDPYAHHMALLTFLSLNYCVATE